VAANQGAPEAVREVLHAASRRKQEANKRKWKKKLLDIGKAIVSLKSVVLFPHG
jgi:hypothetical protein